MRSVENWYEAVKNCKKVGMKLVEVDNEEENQKLQSFFKERTFGTFNVNGFHIVNYWTAGFNTNRQDIWQWNGSNKRIDFKQWAPKQPDNDPYHGSEHCLELLYFTNSKLFWNDANCLMKKLFICETYE